MIVVFFGTRNGEKKPGLNSCTLIEGRFMKVIEIMLNSAKVRVILPRLVEIKIPGEEFCHYLR
jgi:hypothetical protein